ncbi:MAG: MBL fold metallo-hydrolase [Limnochordales bacterium]|nr:MBL fold metallo-hydrolase [Limnochordales bacterium]
MNKVDVLIQPFCLRFSLHKDEIVYLVASSAEMQLDEMERFMGIDPAKDQLFDSNLGFLPVATTTLIRGEKTILVDPGAHHVGFYGMLKKALQRFDLTFDDVDMVVLTHSHHDHAASMTLLAGKPVVLGEGELEYARAGQSPAEVDARFGRMGPQLVVPAGGSLELCPGVVAIHTPGHTPGHISVLVEAGDERVAVTGDLVMVQAEYERRWGHWYSPETVAQLNDSLTKVRDWGPTLVLPGHDRAFRPR